MIVLLESGAEQMITCGMAIPSELSTYAILGHTISQIPQLTIWIQTVITSGHEQFYWDLVASAIDCQEFTTVICVIEIHGG